MKLFLSLFLLLAIVVSASAQDVDKRLYARFDKSQMAELVENHPAVIEYWTFYLDNAYEIEEAPAGKDLSQLPTVQIKDPDDFNILALDVSPSEKFKQNYRIENSNKLLVMRSSEEIVRLFNEYRASH